MVSIMRDLSLKHFLKNACKSLIQHTVECLVIGNESADLDSIISALLMAYSYAFQDNRQVIPIINCQRRDYKLHTESYGLLKRYDIDETDLVFIDDIPVELLELPGSLSITVVDHNQLSDNLSNWNQNVTAILDHHKDTGSYPHADPRIFSSVGSCSTLVAEYILNQTDVVISKEIATLLLAPIVLDTINLDRSHGRVSEADITIASRLMEISMENPDKLYHDLQAMKMDVSTLSLLELLRKDYKQWTATHCNYGIASVPLSLHQWLQRDPQAGPVITSYMQTNRLSLFFIMTAYVDVEFNREMVICCEQKQHLAALEKLFNDSGLQLTELDEMPETLYSCKSYQQAGLTFSRKKVQPIVADFILNGL